MASGVKVKHSKPITIDLQPAVRTVAPVVIRDTRERIAKGLDHNGRSMGGYSELYRKQLAAIGQSAGVVDFRLTGSLMASIALRRAKEVGGGARIYMTFGPYTGSRVEQVRRPPPWVFDRNKTPEELAHALARWRNSSGKKQRGISAFRILLFNGIRIKGRQRRTPMGIAEDGLRHVQATLEQSRIFAGGV